MQANLTLATAVAASQLLHHRKSNFGIEIQIFKRVTSHPIGSLAFHRPPPSGCCICLSLFIVLFSR